MLTLNEIERRAYAEGNTALAALAAAADDEIQDLADDSGRTTALEIPDEVVAQLL
jgi:hypothetical protein